MKKYPSSDQYFKKKAKERADEGNGNILIPYMQTDDIFANTKVFLKMLQIRQ